LIDGALAKIDDALDRLPPSLLARSGSVFYSGREAFSARSRLYLLGLNPGGNPLRQADETIARHIGAYRERSDTWSEYRDESWCQAPPGTWGMQPRVLHMLDRLGLDPRYTPASNVVFARTRNEMSLQAEKNSSCTYAGRFIRPSSTAWMLKRSSALERALDAGSGGSLPLHNYAISSLKPMRAAGRVQLMRELTDALSLPLRIPAALTGATLPQIRRL
jgi:hypothetical protein